MAYQLILAGLGDMFFGSNGAEMDELLSQAFTEYGEPSFNSVTILKNKGNMFFKEGHVPLGFFHYKIGLKFLLRMGILPSSDEPSAISLAISLLLNLDACDLKGLNYDQVCWYCNLILYVDPSNIKALYRRGLAFKHLNLLPMAYADFECAFKHNPHNQDISRELQVVKDRLAVNSNGKRESPQFDPLGMERKGNKPLVSPVSFDDCIPVRSPDVHMDSESSSAPVETSNEPVVCISSSTTSNSPQFNFTNKKRPYNKLNLSSQDYEQLLHGKNLGFYHPRSMSFMRVRTLTSKTIQTGTPHEEISGTAEVPTSSPLPENFLKTIDVEEQTKSVELVQEEVIFQVDKKTHLTSASSSVSKVSLVQFKFAAVWEHLHGNWKRNMHRSHGKGRMGQSIASSRKRSSVSVSVLTCFCRYTHSVTTVTRAKRKEVQSIKFDAHYHPPFKKCRIFSSTTSTFSSVSRVSSSLGGFTAPLFVI